MPRMSRRENRRSPTPVHAPLGWRVIAASRLGRTKSRSFKKIQFPLDLELPLFTVLSSLPVNMSQETIEVSEQHRFDEASLVRYLTQEVPGFSGGALTVKKFGYGQVRLSFIHSRPPCAVPSMCVHHTGHIGFDYPLYPFTSSSVYVAIYILDMPP